MRLRSRRPEPEVIRITAAPHNPGDDISRRQSRYVLSMSIRTVCFVGAVLVVSIPWLCATLIVASFLLPFVAVVIANAAAPRVSQDLEGPGLPGRYGSNELGSPADPTD